jgi:dynamin 1-like protein
MKELNGLNGVETPEDEEEVDATVGQIQPRTSKQTRSMSPAVPGKGLNGTHSLAAQFGRTASPSRIPGQAGGSARDSFLNYFFGKEEGGAFPISHPNAPMSPTGALPDRPGSRHVSTSIEPSFANSFRRGDPRTIPDATPEYPDVRDNESLMVSKFPQ